MIHTRFAALVLACALPGAAAAVDVRILAAAPVAPGLTKVGEQYRKDTKNRVRIVYIAAPQLERRISAGEAADILVASPGLMNDQLRRNKIDPEKHVFIGRVSVGVAIRAGAFDVDISTLDRFKQTLLGADSIVYAQPGPGTYLEKLVELLGIGEKLQAKTTRYISGTQVLEHILLGKGIELGFATIPEIKAFESRGLKFAGPLPEQIQFTTAYSAGVLTDASEGEVAGEFLQYLDTPASKAIFTAAGFD